MMQESKAEWLLEQSFTEKLSRGLGLPQSWCFRVWGSPAAASPNQQKKGCVMGRTPASSFLKTQFPDAERAEGALCSHGKVVQEMCLKTCGTAR